MNKLLILSISAIMLFTGCGKVYELDSYKETAISFNQNYEQGDRKGYEDGKSKKTEYVNKLYPLQNSYSQYDLGYINGYYVGCQEVKSDCAKIEELVEQILEDKTDKYKVQTNNEIKTSP